MFSSFYVSATGVDAASSFLDVTANNVSNADTFGYKTGQITFQDLLYQTLTAPGLQTANTSLPTGTQTGLGVAVDGVNGLFTQGTLVSTGVQLDVAVDGNGFLQLALPDGTTAYTRNGALGVDASGQLVSSQGYVVSPNIVIPPDATSVSIATDGTVTAQTPTGTQEVGQLTLARFIDPSGLLRIGDTLYAATGASGPATVGTPGTNGLGLIRQGELEGSNVDLTSELVNLLVAQQMSSANSRALVVEDSLLADTADLISLA